MLHLKQLPTFDDTLRAPEAELLLQYLTVPYLRVPLLLRFFSQPSHAHALGSPKLQSALLHFSSEMVKSVQSFRMSSKVSF